MIILLKIWLIYLVFLCVVGGKVFRLENWNNFCLNGLIIYCWSENYDIIKYDCVVYFVRRKSLI